MSDATTSLPWVEKYRPKTVEHLQLEKRIQEKMCNFTDKSVPHLLLFGPPGTGKTTAALALANRVGSDVVELNASDNRGVNMISELVNSFCRVITGDDRKATKVIVLDEADNITRKAQQQLVNFMENYKHIRIFFTCNDFNQIIEPLQSRCMLIKFPKPTNGVTVLGNILDTEGVKWESKALEKVLDHSLGDLRAAINACQGVVVCSGEVNLTTVSKYFYVPAPSEIYTLLYKAVQEDKENLPLVINDYFELTRSGLNGVDMMTTLIEALQSEERPRVLSEIPQERMYKILEHAHHTYYRMLNTVESVNQMVRFFYKIAV